MTDRFLPTLTPIEGLLVLDRVKLGDERGFLTRLFCAEELAALGWDGSVMQVNETGTTAAGTVRGMHFQHPPHAEIKLVTCVAGRVVDVAVDLRPASPTYLQHFSVELSGENHRSFLIPKGFAHGFQALSDNVRMIYAHSERYVAQSEGGLHPLDPQLGISWPLPVINLSNRDSNHPLIGADFRGVAA